MKRLVNSCLLLLLVVLVVISCAPEVTPIPAPIKPPEKAPVEGKTSWQEEWDKTVAAARNEGQLVIYFQWGADLQDVLRKPLKEKYGIDIEFIVGRATEQVAKIFAERRGGLYWSDLWLGGAGTMLTELKPAGAFAPIKPLLLLPEVLDKNAYFDNEVPFLDKDMYIIPHAQPVGNSLAINTDLVKPGDLKGYADLLNPKWKEKIIINDPTIPGTAREWFYATAMVLMSPDFHRQLVKQDPLVTRDLRQQLEWLAKGKYPIVISPFKAVFAEFEKLGAPIAWVSPVEGEFVTPSGCVAYFDRAPHPNAAKVFVNWLMTKEGLTAWSQASLWVTARKDVPTAFLPPASIRQPNIKYYNLSKEEEQWKVSDAMKLSKEIYGPLIK